MSLRQGHPLFRSLYLSLVFGAMLVMGIAAPFAASLGYVWVDTFAPQFVAYSMLTEIPVSLIMAIAAFGTYFVVDRRAPPRIDMIIGMMLLFAVWVSITTVLFAVVPAEAWFKWNWAIKTIIFSAFMPFVFRSRIQIEAFLQVYILSMASQYLPFAAKTLVTGGGYGMGLGLVQGNSRLAEGAALSTAVLMALPLILHLRKYTLIVPQTMLTRLGYLGLAAATIPAAIGTYERTALVGMAVAGVGLWLMARRKLLLAVVAAVALAAALPSITSSVWTERMATTKNFAQESSAHNRILVWEWTLGFVQTHPFGGGFNSFYADQILVPDPIEPEKSVIRQGVAFHSIYFEVLGEHGWPGLAIFLALIAASFLGARNVARRCRGVPELAWCRNLALSLQISFAVVLVCGAFIGIAFQAMLWNMFALAAMLRHHVRMVERERMVVASKSWGSAPDPAGASAPRPALIRSGGVQA